jgi:hypothetical protein
MPTEPQKPHSQRPDSQSCQYNNSFLLEGFYACAQRRSRLHHRLNHRNLSHSRLTANPITTTKVCAENIIKISEQAFRLL